jgi:hypothetical protein
MEDRDGSARRWNGARSPPPKRLRVRRQYDPGAPVALSASTSQFQCDDATPGSARHATAHFAPDRARCALAQPSPPDTLLSCSLPRHPQVCCQGRGRECGLRLTGERKPARHHADEAGSISSARLAEPSTATGSDSDSAPRERARPFGARLPARLSRSPPDGNDPAGGDPCARPVGAFPAPSGRAA